METRNTISKICYLILFLFLTLTSFAQEIEIISPLMHEGSVGAASVPNDNNGNPCAKIIVDIPVEDAVIEGAYIVGNVKEKAGRYEFFVSVPKKNGQKFCVRHSNYGSIDIPIWTEQGALVGREAYIIKLKAKNDEKVIVDMHGNKVEVASGNFEIVKHEDAGGQYLVMRVSPADASVEIDGQFVSAKNGVLQKFLTYGNHSYRVYHPMYEDKTGSVSVNNEKVSVNIDLKPIFGFLQIYSAPESGADVYIDGNRVGQTPFKTNALKEGSYAVRVVKEMFEPKEESAIVKRGETATVTLEMKPTFGNITIKCADKQALLVMNGKELGKGFWTGRLERGRYQIEARRNNYRTTSKTIDVTENTSMSYELEAPNPIVGSLNITSDPIGARIRIDGKDMGETPNIISGLLIGTHTVSLSKQGCGDFERTISIEEGKITPLEVTLEKGKMLTITTDKNGDEIYINGKLAGTSPLTTSLPFGNHQIYAKRGNDKTDTEIVNVTATTTSSVSLSFVPMIAGHEYVDLGLPSGLKWATCNVGANKPEETGYYFAWGETKTKASYTESNSETYGESDSWLTSNGYIDSNGNLTKTHDAASANWGSTWRMPTEAEIDELIENTTTEWTTRNGVYGRLVKSKRNGKSIFIPAAGYRNGARLYSAGEYGECWSSTPNEGNARSAYYLFFGSGNFFGCWSSRYSGRSVRPVSSKTVSDEASQYRNQSVGSANINATKNDKSTTGIKDGHEYVDLGLPSGLKWATCNVGATKPEEYGSYFAWGETSTKSSYTERNSETHGKKNFWLKRNGYIDSKGNLTKAHDAANANWGSTWRMPTQSEIDELVENTTTEWITRNGVKGLLVKSKRNGKSIFVPAAGYRYGTHLGNAGVGGYCWSSTPYESSTGRAYTLDFDSGAFYRDWNGRGDGRSVRPVSE